MKAGREISRCGCLYMALLGTWPATQACALTGNQTGDPLLHSPALNPLSHTSQGPTKRICSSLSLHLYYPVPQTPSPSANHNLFSVSMSLFLLCLLINTSYWTCENRAGNYRKWKPKHLKSFACTNSKSISGNSYIYSSFMSQHKYSFFSFLISSWMSLFFTEFSTVAMSFSHWCVNFMWLHSEPVCLTVCNCSIVWHIAGAQ